MPHKRVSINCDIGEGYFRWNLGPDEALMQLVDYANIACGFHAGDYNTMVRTVRAAIKYGVKMGAHPGLDDVKGFGRRKIDVSPDDIYASTLYQLGALKAIIEAEGGKFSHVKPHGMLFFILRDSEPHMRAFMKAQTAIFGTSIPFFGFLDSNHSKICAELGVRFVPEVYLDIDYNKDGVLLGVPGSRPASVELVKKKAEKLMTEAKTYDLDDNLLHLKPADGNFSICMHSDLPGALDMVKSLREIVDKYNK